MTCHGVVISMSYVIQDQKGTNFKGLVEWKFQIMQSSLILFFAFWLKHIH
jgi:hypothetical protein